MPYDYYDYHTGKVNGKDIFDTSTTGNSTIDVLRNPQYFEKEKNLKGEIVQMSPNEYFQECAKIFDSTASKQKMYAGADPDYTDHLKSVINIKQDKFPVSYIDYAREMQEGRHRMFVAGELFGFDTKFPVLVIDYANKDRAEREEQERNYQKSYNKIEKAISRAIAYSYNDIGEFIDQLQFEINDQFFVMPNEDNIPFDLQIDENDDNIIHVTHQDKNAPYIDIDIPIHLDEINIEKSISDDWLDDIDEEDLRTVSGE